MTNREPHSGAIPENIEAMTPPENSSQAALLAANLTEVLHHPAFTTIGEMTTDGVGMDPVGFYAQQMALGYKLTQGALDRPGPLVNSEIMSGLDNRRMEMFIKGVHGFHTLIHGMALHFEVDRDTFATSFAKRPSAELTTPLAMDYMALCSQGLVNREGVTGAVSRGGNASAHAERSFAVQQARE